MIEKISKQNIGNAGEFYAAYLLSSKNCVVTVTLGRNEGYDLIAVTQKGNTYKISVKTRNTKTQSIFPMSDKDENFKGDDFFYFFIRLNNFEDEPDYWIVPSKIVSSIVKKSYEKWLKEPNKHGEEHQNSKMRNFWVINSKYCPEGWSEEIKKYYKNMDILEA